MLQEGQDKAALNNSCRPSLNEGTLFLSLPQASLFVHSFCTRGKCFSIAACGDLPQSGCIENVEFSRLAGW
jgi:hypothetical protein